LEEAMNKRERSAGQQRVHDKSVIDHLTNETPAARRPRKFGEENGRELAEALKKRWTTSRNGGLPDF
jgi:hypothetical protein